MSLLVQVFPYGNMGIKLVGHLHRTMQGQN